jgi:hypothetical protein
VIGVVVTALAAFEVCLTREDKAPATTID